MCLCCLRFLFFFFFKQKTAYEMRISDWSSDVCSSDLGVALEEGRFGIRANCVGPGFIDAGLGHELLSKPGLEDFTEGLRKMLPLKRFGEARDIADAVLFLLSNQARYITGQSQIGRAHV